MREPQRVVTCPKCGYADFAGAPHECEPPPLGGVMDVGVPVPLEPGGRASDVTVTMPREEWLAIVYAVYCAEDEGQADSAAAAPIMAALGFAEWEPHVLPPEVDEYERRLFAEWRRKQEERKR